MRIPFLGILFLLAIWTRLLLADGVERVTQKGPVRAVVRLEPADLLIGDSATLSLEVTAQKGVELLMPSFGQALERFAIIDFSSKAQIDSEGRTIAIQQYELQPPRSGRQSIPPIMIEFVDRRDGATPAPQRSGAHELLTERVSFDVRSALPDDAKADLHPPLGRLPQPQPGRGNLWPWGIGVMALIAGVGWYVWRIWVASRRKARRRSAYDIASTRLTRLLDQPCDEPGQFDAFFVELSAIVRQYLEDRFDLRAPELTTEEFLALMSRSPDLLHDHQSLLRQFLRGADLVKFANVVPSAQDIDQSVAAARRFLNDTRQDGVGPNDSAVGSTSVPVARV